MSCDSYYRRKVVTEISNKKVCDEARGEFNDDRELLAYLLEQERRVELLKHNVTRDLTSPLIPFHG